MGRITTVFLMALCHTIGMAQTTINGTVIDRITREPLAFANIAYNNKFGIIADIDGRFSLITPSSINRIKCSYIGYKPYDQVLSETSNLVIEMTPTINELTEIVVAPGADPADQVIRKAIANKKTNNPENLSSFRYTCYNKMVFDFLFHKNKRDSISISRMLLNSHLLLTESVSERQFLKPDLSEEVVLATRFSGFKNPAFAALATDLQPFSFYQDYIKLFDIRYLNPISEGALKKYKFRLEEEIHKDRDTIFIISFKPIKDKNFDALEGMLYINSNKYAIQNVIASPFEKGKINLKIQQQYQYIDKAYWFPEQLNYTLTIEGYPNKNIGIYSEGKSYISNVSVNFPLSKKDFSDFSVRIDSHATQKDSGFWQKSRNIPLTNTEKNTYRVIDSIGQSQHFDRYLKAIEKIFVGRFPLPYLDIDLNKTFLYNKYEGLRLGTGFVTNADLSRNMTFSGSFGYGLKDEKWKYALGADYMINPQHNFSIGVDYQDNLNEMGSYGLKSYTTNLFDFRKLIGFRYDRIEQAAFNIHFQNLRYAQWNISVSQTRISPQYNYQFNEKAIPVTSYRKTDLNIYFRYAYAEKLINSFENTFSSAAKYPVVYVCFSKGFKNFAAGNFDYVKLEIAAEHSFYIRNFGLTKYWVEGSWINQSLPAGLLFTGEGSCDADLPFVIKNTFQTMRPYEFLSDRFANLFLSHHFGSLLFKTRFVAPGISIHSNIGWGTLKNPENHQFIAFNTKEKIYLECGLQLANLLKINYANLGYIGLGTAAFYRYGAYALADPQDNITLKATINFTIQ